MTANGHTSFTQTRWDLEERVLIQQFIVGTGQGDAETARAILQAKASIAARVAADESRRVADATKFLAWATIVMAVATVAMVVVAMIGILHE
jgi:hypothetical protein